MPLFKPIFPFPSWLNGSPIYFITRSHLTKATFSCHHKSAELLRQVPCVYRRWKLGTRCRCISNIQTQLNLNINHAQSENISIDFEVNDSSESADNNVLWTISNCLDTSITKRSRCTSIVFMLVDAAELKWNMHSTPMRNQWAHCEKQHRVIGMQVYRAGPAWPPLNMPLQYRLVPHQCCIHGNHSH